MLPSALHYFVSHIRDAIALLEKKQRATTSTFSATVFDLRQPDVTGKSSAIIRRHVNRHVFACSIKTFSFQRDKWSGKGKKSHPFKGTLVLNKTIIEYICLFDNFWHVYKTCSTHCFAVYLDSQYFSKLQQLSYL